MANITDILVPAQMAVYWTDKAAQEQAKHLNRILFPRRKQISNMITTVKGSSGIPVTMTPSKYDADPTLRERRTIETYPQVMPFFKEEMSLNEEQAMELENIVMSSANMELIDMVAQRVYNDQYELVTGAEATLELMAMQALSTGQINIKRNGVQVSVDYHLKNWQKTKVAKANAWSNHATSDPIQDLMNAKREASTHGVVITRAIMSNKTFLDMIASEKLKAAMSISALVDPSAFVVDDASVIAFILRKTGIGIRVSSALYSNQLDGPTFPYMPDDVVSLLPGMLDGPIGEYVFGRVPAERSNRHITGIATLNMGLVVYTYENTRDPWGWYTTLAYQGLPSIGQDYVIMNVAG